MNIIENLWGMAAILKKMGIWLEILVGLYQGFKSIRRATCIPNLMLVLKSAEFLHQIAVLYRIRQITSSISS